MIGIPLGWLVSNASEWLIHKYWLHGRGKNRKSFWSFHWHDHHKSARTLGMEDPDYLNTPFKAWDPQTKEIAALLAGAAVHAPLFPVAPFYVATVWFCAARYYHVHKKSHLDPEWAKEHLPWHWDHHMGPNQDANWCVTHPFFDQVMGTRKEWLGTEEEVASRARREHFQKLAKEKRAAGEKAANDDDAQAVAA